MWMEVYAASVLMDVEAGSVPALNTMATLGWLRSRPPLEANSEQRACVFTRLEVHIASSPWKGSHCIHSPQWYLK